MGNNVSEILVGVRDFEDRLAGRIENQTKAVSQQIQVQALDTICTVGKEMDRKLKETNANFENVLNQESQLLQISLSQVEKDLKEDLENRARIHENTGKNVSVKVEEVECSIKTGMEETFEKIQQNLEQSMNLLIAQVQRDSADVKLDVLDMGVAIATHFGEAQEAQRDHTQQLRDKVGKISGDVVAKLDEHEKKASADANALHFNLEIMQNEIQSEINDAKDDAGRDQRRLAGMIQEQFADTNNNLENQSREITTQVLSHGDILSRDIGFLAEISKGSFAGVNANVSQCHGDIIECLEKGFASITTAISQASATQGAQIAQSTDTIMRELIDTSLAMAVDRIASDSKTDALQQHGRMQKLQQECEMMFAKQKAHNREMQEIKRDYIRETENNCSELIDNLNTEFNLLVERLSSKD